MSNESANVPELYSFAGATRVAINGMAKITDDTEIPLGVRLGKSGAYSIGAVTVQNLSAATLIDKATNTEFDLTAGDAYEFTGDAGDDDSRFSIRFKTPTGIQAQTASSLRIFAANGRIIISDAKHNSTVQVYNTIGQKLAERRLTDGYAEIGTLVSGVYLVRVDGKTEKVIVK